ncbi:CDP-glycerol glycerophosphotransferase family protein [Lactobacillus mulieris]|uniref:CDP-glycerol glycerophosphotransferase family protein n=1 Tax=Lactobacillus mulieris TaxID=2508708 RepID=UPI001432A689|nr:CDP-glycerol glycerophosphotransferase family protein [Lactobacillus mulieris]MCF1783853.1 CDP-glycerol glycerophosphotransferase family protein [Lactobacillus mulieris]MCW8104715.1 CDP-glycerol glycerophosphotransferase family protein [Lactobacillus mulieris]MDK6803635.1 CDP-glycerol glycerophosphotransferase family protein [Lactobacillus mulieris]MDK8382811.1 CDP-glycerol glycerophosphotransferase family protein [Lactobacillus mulieris]MDT9620962.1 CDP-glycerol glycerophosphotransferase f
MKTFIFGLYLNLMKLLAHLIPTDKQGYVILNGAGRSGSNGYLFYKYLKDRHPELNVTLVEPWPSSHLPWKIWRKIGAAKYIFTTHEPFKIKKKQINISFWHGIPLKRMGFMAHNTTYSGNKKNMNIWHKEADYVVSSSDFYETLMSSCVGIEAKKYVKTGFPRLDYLKGSFSKAQILNDFFSCTDNTAKIGIYMPTFRFELEDKDVMERIKSGNFFALSDFNLHELNMQLKRNNQYLIIKLHPYEMNLVKSSQQSASNIYFLNNEYLVDNKVDLYEILGATDFLLTDFSSIYFDYLLLNKPIIFIDNLLKEYVNKRGLLLSPYSDIVPGELADSQKKLLEVLSKMDEDKFEERRLFWKKITLEQNSNCCQSIYELTKRMN